MKGGDEKSHIGRTVSPSNLKVFIASQVKARKLLKLETRKQLVHLFGQVSVENDDGGVEDKEKRLHLVRLSALHVTRGQRGQTIGTALP